MGVLTSIEGSNPSFSVSRSWPGGLRPAEPASEPPSRPWPGSGREPVHPSTVLSAYADPGTRQKSEVPCVPVGGVAERSNAAVSKTVSGR
jgi:hypothetical protein